MRKIAVAVGLIALAVACGKGGPTAPEPTQPESSVSTPTAAVPPAPAPVPPVPDPVTGPSFEGQILPNAGWFVRNLSTNISVITAYYTSFDNQSLSLGAKVGTIQPRDTFEGSFEKTCVQVDLTYGYAGDAPFLAGFIDDKGKVVQSINQGIRDRCAPKCEPKFTTREATTYVGEGCSRVKRVTTYTLNSCSKEETSTYVDTKDPQSSDYYTGEFKINSLSDSGLGYYITDDGVLSPLWQDLRLTLVNKNALGAYHYSHALDGSVLALSHQVGFLGSGFLNPDDEFIGSAKAQCSNPTADWHGSVSFVCTKHNTCEQ